MQATDENIALFRSLFVCRDEPYPEQYSPEPGVAKWTVKREPLTKDVLLDHLESRNTIGLYSSAESMTKWMAVDLDQRDEQPVQETVERARKQGLPVYVEDSGRRGWHVWCFFNRLVPNAVARRIGLSLAPRGVEVFPKQDKLGDGPGSLIKAPLGVHQATGNRCLFVDEKFEPYPDQWALLRAIERVTPILTVVRNQPSTSAPPCETPSIPKPCVLNAIRDGAAEGKRKRTALVIASEMRRLGSCRDEAMGVLRAWNLRCTPPLPFSEIEDALKSAYSRTYQFGCEESAFIRRELTTCVGLDACRYYEAFVELQRLRARERGRQGQQAPEE